MNYSGTWVEFVHCLEDSFRDEPAASKQTKRVHQRIKNVTLKFNSFTPIQGLVSNYGNCYGFCAGFLLVRGWSSVFEMQQKASNASH